MRQYFCYLFFLFIFCFASPAHALTSGTTTTGSITTPGGTSNESFSGTAGQSVIIYANSDYGVVMRVYKPDSSYWFTATNRLTATLTDDGTYTVEVSFSSGAVTGDYSLDYVKGGGGVSSGSLSSGQSYSGSIGVNGLQSYQFTGDAGQGVMIHADASYTPQIRVYRPDGSYWNYGNDRFVNPLPVSGTYTVVISGYSYANTGSYRVDFLLGGEGVSSGTIKSGRSYNASLERNGIISYQFDGTAGQRILIYGDASYTPQFRVYRPDGTGWTLSSTRFANTLPATGTYTLAVTGYSVANNGSYRMDFVKGDSTVSDGVLISDSERSGSLQRNGLESYVFSATASNPITVASSGSFNRVLSIFRPDGSTWISGTNSLSNSNLPATGEYTLVLYGSGVPNTGAYTVEISTPQPVPPPSDPEQVGKELDSCGKSQTGEVITSADGQTQDSNSGLSPSNMVGNPINFDVGFKKQVEVDYNAGGLLFSRIYRSDSTWTDNTIGDLWRHNYARSLDFTGSAAEIIDGTGAKTTYSLSGSDWVPDDPDTMATFETVGSTYVYTLPDNTVEKYNSSEQLTRIEYVGGGALNLSYNGSGELTTVTNENGRSLTFNYTSGRVSSLVTPDGTFTYAYDANDNLEEVTKPDTNTVEYHYEDATYVNALTGITDEEGVRFATFDYDANGKAILSEHAGNVEDYDVTYNVDGTATTTNPLGKETTYHFMNIQGVRRIVQVDGEPSTNCVASNRYYNYDELGRVISKTDWENNITRFEYDDRSNITQIIRASGTDEEQVTTITYNNDFNLPELVTEEGKTTDYDYDTYGRMTSVTVTDTNTSETRITTYTYNTNTTDGSGNTILGRLSEIDGPRTDVTDTTDFTYDANLDLETITNALGQVTEITARDSAGRPTTIEDVNGVETDLVYDSNGWLISSTVAPGTGLEAETTYGYDDNGNLTLVTLPNGATLAYTYDNAQRMTGVEDALGNTITYTLDAAGNVTQVDYENSTPTLKYTHDSVYDELSRIIQSVGAAAQTAEFEYDKNSNLTTYTDPNTNDTDYAYDALERLVSTTDALSGVTELGYNDLDYLTSVEDQRDNTTTYTYNAFGDVTGEVSPDRGTIAYVVDKAGNITQMTDARSIVTNYTYDALNRLTDIEYPSDSSLDAELTYDLVSGCGTAPKGRLCKVDDASGVTEYQYNDLGQLTSVEETRGGLTFTTGYTYDLAGNVLTITLPSGRVVTYTRNANGQVSAVSADVNATPTTLASSITYLPFGPMDAMTYGNSLTFSASYDQDYYLTNRTVSGGIYNHTYDTDPNGNITQVGGTDYEYDELNRLDNEDDGSAISYTYDATSNRLTRVDGGTTSTTVPSTSNKISAVGGDAYTYDAAGNITDDDTNTYSWNAAGQLATVNTTDGVYTYDSQNMRTKKVAGGNTVHYVYGLNGLLYGEYDNSGNLIREYVYLNDEPLAQIDDVSSSDVLTYLHVDHLSTPRFATNTGGMQVWSWTGDAFGVGAPSGSVTVNLRMPGQYYDAESGLFYNWNRYYNPAIGRYISSDPIGLEGGLNTFLYSMANPVMYTDPEGLQGEFTKRALAGAAADAMTPEPSDAIGYKWLGWGGIVATSVVIDWCLADQTDIGKQSSASDKNDVDDDCEILYQQIRNDISILKKRYDEMRIDRYEQFTKAYDKPDPDSPTNTTWKGHQKQFSDVQNRLKKRLLAANTKGCINYPSDAWSWAMKPSPTQPAPK